jgi:hypothetical protein
MVAAGNILTDAAIALPPILVILPLQMSLNKKLAISGLLGCRIL